MLKLIQHDKGNCKRLKNNQLNKKNYEHDRKSEISF